MNAAISSETGRWEAARFERARSVLAAAFRDYPAVRALLPAGRRRAGALAWYVGFGVTYCLKYGEVYEAPTHDGVAAFLKPGPHFTYPRLLAAGLLLGPLRLGFRPFWRLMQNDTYIGTLRVKHALPGSWYIWFVGVAPAAQGHGVGGQLLRRVLGDADAAAAPCYLDTHHAANVPFYRAHGFEVVSEGHVPSSGLPYWAMSRPPATPAASDRRAE